jgi:hypothetical protein
MRQRIGLKWSRVRVEKDGHYVTRGSLLAEVYELRGAYCMGFVHLADGSRKTAMWQIEQGAIMGGSPERDLVEYVRPFH